MRKYVLIIIAIMFVASGGSFYGGMKYAESKSRSNSFPQANSQNFSNLSLEERQQKLQELGANIGNSRGTLGGQRGAGTVNGEIISKDDKSITIKLRDGGSKIVFLSDTIEITKSTKSSTDNLKTGTQVFISGAQNSDGSLTAQTVQIR